MRLRARSAGWTEPARLPTRPEESLTRVARALVVAATAVAVTKSRRETTFKQFA